MQSLTLASLQSARPSTVISRRGLISTPIVPLINTNTHFSSKRCSSPVIAKAAPAPPPVEAVWEATGVPLVDELASFSTLQGSAIHAVKLVAIAMAGIYIGSLLVKAISNKVGFTRTNRNQVDLFVNSQNFLGFRKLIDSIAADNLSNDKIN
jgi:hypothetical protein